MEQKYTDATHTIHTLMEDELIFLINKSPRIQQAILNVIMKSANIKKEY